MTSLDRVLAAVEEGRRQPLYLVVGDRVLAEPAAVRLGERLAAATACEVEVRRRPADLGSLLADLRTYSLFSAAKVVVAVDSAVLADLGAAGALLRQAAAAAGVTPGGELPERARGAAARLLQALKLYRIDPYAGPAEEAVGRLPAEVFRDAAGKRRPKAQVASQRETLAVLLEAARAAGLEGRAESDLAALSEIAAGGLPEGHTLILAESAVAADHPLVATLAGQEAVVELAAVSSGREGWSGLDALAQELERQTGVAIAAPALDELASRTLHPDRKRRGKGPADAESTARLAAEYRKLAGLADGRIERELVVESVEDRGEEDLFKILDAVGGGAAGDAAARLRRLGATAEDPTAARLAVFGQLAEFARHLVAVGSLLDRGKVQRDVRSYPRFKSGVAPLLQAELEGGRPNPLAGLHPYRLFKAYRAAARAPRERLERLPERLLDTELLLKGESTRPATALEELVVEVARVAGGGR